MRTKLRFIKSKLVFLAAVMLAAVVGGLSTNLVRASVPDAGGRVTVCYRNNGGDMHVIDTSTDSCSNKETSLIIDQPSSGIVSLAGKDLTDQTYDFSWHDFRNANFIGTTFDGDNLNHSDFRGATFDPDLVGGFYANYANFSGVDLSDRDFGNNDVLHADFSNADLSGSTIIYADFTGANFTGTNVTGLNWGTDSVCPDGTVSGNQSNTCIGHLVP